MKKFVFALVFILAAVLCAGCVDDEGGDIIPATPTLTLIPTQTIPEQTSIYGTWFSQYIIDHKDPIYKNTISYDVEVVFEKGENDFGGKGHELWKPLNGASQVTVPFNWIKNTDGSYDVYYSDDNSKVRDTYSSIYTLSFDGKTLMDSEAYMFSKMMITHTPTPTPVPTQVAVYKTDNYEKLRGEWTSLETVKSSNNKPCKLIYTFNQGGDGVEIWNMTNEIGNAFTYNFEWEQATDGKYIVTMLKGFGGVNGEYQTEVRIFQFITPEFTRMMDDRGYTYVKTLSHK